MEMKLTKAELLKETVEHIDITRHDVVPLVDAMAKTSFSARDLGRAAHIYDRMIRDTDCGIIFCLAGSIVSAGLKKVIVDAIRNKMCDAIVSTGAILVDQDFFEALGYRHYIGAERLKAGMDDDKLRDLHIDRIYDHLIDEDQLRDCDETMKQMFDSLPPGGHSSRAILKTMGAWLEKKGCKTPDSIVFEAYKHQVPLFVPAFSDCSAGFGYVAHVDERRKQKKPHAAIDSGMDFYEITQLKLKNPTTGLFMIGGGVPKNFAQDIVVAADILGHDAPMHKYAVQITVADVRDGALSGSTLKEASSWGKVDTVFEQMVYSEATIAVPLIVGYGYHKGGWRNRNAKNFGGMLD